MKIEAIDATSDSASPMGTIKKHVSDGSRVMPVVGSNGLDSEKRCAITEFSVLYRMYV